jgi:hypothetical protein
MGIVFTVFAALCVLPIVVYGTIMALFVGAGLVKALIDSIGN